MKIKTKEFATGTFVNYEGVEQHFTVAIVSFIPDAAFSTFYVDESYTTVCNKIVMGIGTAFCKPKSISCPEGDEYDEELGKRIALSHALSGKAFAVIHQSEMGFVDAKIRNAMLLNIVENIKEEPERYSISYRKDMEKFLKEKKYYEDLESLSSSETALYSMLKNVDNNSLNKVLNLLEYKN